MKTIKKNYSVTLKRIFMIFMVCIFASTLLGCGERDPIKHSRKLFERALKKIEEKDFHKAIITLKYAIHLNPQLRDAYYYLGMAYYDIGSVSDAMASLKIYVKYFPKHLETRIKLAEMSYIGGDYDDFFENVEVIKQLDPKNFRIVELLADYYYKKGDTPAAIYYYTKVIKHNKSDVESRIRLAKIYFRENRISQTKNLLEECDSLSPDNPGIRQLFYDIYEREGNFPKMVIELERLAKFRQGDARLNIERKLALMFFSREKYDKSVVLAKKILRSESQDPLCHYIFGKLAYMKGNYSKALKELRISANMSYEPVDSRFTMGKIYESLKQPLKAVEEYREVSYLDSSFFDVHPILAELYIKMGKYDSAISEAYDMLRLRLTYEHPEAYYYLGLSYFKKKIYGRSIGYLKDFIKYGKKTSRDAESNYLIGVSFMKRIVERKSLSAPVVDDPILGRIIEEEEEESVKDKLDIFKEIDKEKEGIGAKRERKRRLLGINSPGLRNIMEFEQLPLEDPLPYFNKAIEINPLYGEAYVLRAIINHARGNLFLAVDDAKVSLSFRTSNTELSHFVLGNIYISMGNLAKAVESFGQVKNLLPDFKLTNLAIINCFDTRNPILVSRLNVAMYMILNKWYDEAVRECNIVLGENQKNTIARYIKENIYLIQSPL